RLYSRPRRWVAEDLFSATAAQMSAFNAFSLILSPSWKSMARLVLPSRLELKRPEGSSNEAPFAKVIFTTFLYRSPVQIIPACDPTGPPLHFPSSTTSGSACLMRIRIRASVSPRQSLSSLILASISRGAESSTFPSIKPLLLFFLVVAAFFMAVVACPSLSCRVPSHLVSVSVFEVERAYHVASRVELGQNLPKNSS